MWKRQHRSVSVQGPDLGKNCGHSRHVGTCGCCQRAQLERWNSQLASVQRRRAAAETR